MEQKHEHLSTYTQQMKAVLKDGLSIKDIKSPSESIQIIAVFQNPLAIENISKPSPTVVQAAKDVRMANEDKDMNGCRFFERPSDLKRVIRDWEEIKTIENPSDTMQVYAASQNGLALLYIDKPCYKARMAGVFQNPFAIQLVPFPGRFLELMAVQRDGLCIQLIHNPSEEVQIQAVRQNKHAIELIENPTIGTLRFARDTFSNSLFEYRLVHGASSSSDESEYTSEDESESSDTSRDAEAEHDAIISALGICP